MTHTELPDDLFADEEWQRADYPRRVAYLVLYAHGASNSARIWAQRHEMLAAELRSVREANAQLVRDLESTGDVNARLVLEIERLRPKSMTVPD